MNTDIFKFFLNLNRIGWALKNEATRINVSKRPNYLSKVVYVFYKMSKQTTVVLFLNPYCDINSTFWLKHYDNLVYDAFVYFSFLQAMQIQTLCKALMESRMATKSLHQDVPAHILPRTSGAANIFLKYI